MKYTYSVGIFFFGDYSQRQVGQGMLACVRRPGTQELQSFLEIQANTFGAELVSITETGNRLTAIYRYQAEDVEDDDDDDDD